MTTRVIIQDKEQLVKAIELAGFSIDLAKVGPIDFPTGYEIYTDDDKPEVLVEMTFEEFVKSKQQ